jgi:hypothetical protein
MTPGKHDRAPTGPAPARTLGQKARVSKSGHGRNRAPPLPCRVWAGRYSRYRKTQVEALQIHTSDDV